MSAYGHRSAKRRRQRRNQPGTYHSISSAEEQRFLQQTIQTSKLEKTRVSGGKLDVPWAPTFYPTVEEMEGNPLHYVEKIRPIAEKFGICKISPPKGWTPPCCEFCSTIYSGDVLMLFSLSCLSMEWIKVFLLVVALFFCCKRCLFFFLWDKGIASSFFVVLLYFYVVFLPAEIF